MKNYNESTKNFDAFECPYCGTLYKRESDFHKRRGAVYLKCDGCGSSFYGRKRKEVVFVTGKELDTLKPPKQV